MAGQKTRRIIVVLSSGRAGTSLLMNLLNAFGMRLSEKMIPGSLGNQDGFFEDVEIVEVHKNLLKDLNTTMSLPLPDDWLESEPAQKCRPILRKIVEKHLKKDDFIWGFKDPRTALFLPLWNKIFNTPGIVPVFLLALRNPAQVASSLRRQINKPEIITELQWLLRITEALYHTAGDCFIVHYEDWFKRPDEQAREILTYTGLEHYFQGNLDAILQEVVKSKLNRAVHDEYSIQNKYVSDLYNSLKSCRGSNFNTTQVLLSVKECQAAMNAFKGWPLEAHTALSQKHRRPDADVNKLIVENNRLLKQNIKISGENDELRKRIFSQTDKKHKVKPWEKDNFPITNSYAFCLGRILIDAFMKPGKNTVLMPYLLTKLIWEIITGKGRETTV